MNKLSLWKFQLIRQTGQLSRLSVQRVVKRMVISLVSCLCFIVSSFAQDPVQYGTPFNNVPDARDAVIYQVNMRAFSPSGHFQHVTNRLDNIKALGVNVIYLMPIYPVGQVNSVNSPYSITDYKGIASEFGSLTDLRNLVDGAHNRGMAVILDFVPNHTAWDHPWVSNNWYWHSRDNNGEPISPNGWADVVQLNFDNWDMKQALIDAMRYWVFAANVDGFRFDYADSPTVEFWDQAISSLRSINSHNLLLLAEGARSENYTSGFDYNFGFHFFERLKGVFNGESAQQIDSGHASDYNGANQNQRIVRYTTNHDVNGAEGTPQAVFGGDAAAMSAFVIATYMQATPMIYNGQEVGLPYSLNFPFTNEDIDWSLNPGKTAQYTDIINLFNNNNALRRGSLETFSSNEVVAFTRTTGSERVFVLANTRGYDVNYTLPGAVANLTWQDGFSNGNVYLANNYTVPAYSYRVFKRSEMHYFIKNRWQNAYVYDAGDYAGYQNHTANLNAHWLREAVDGNAFEYRNVATGEYLHLENLTGTVQASSRVAGWYSSRWQETDVGDGYVTLKNLWQTNDYVHIQNLNGYAQYGNADPSWWSSQWLIQPAN